MKRTYEYKCEACGRRFSLRVDSKERNWRKTCPNECMKKLNSDLEIHSLQTACRIISAFPAVIYKE